MKAAQTRRESVVNLMDQRFDWSDALEDVSRTIPTNVWVSQMAATATPAVTVEGGAAHTQRATQTGPAIELVRLHDDPGPRWRGSWRACGP